MVVIFTSGSRGAPKGVIHTHGNAIRAARAALAPRRIERDTRLYVPMPFFWTGGIATGLLPALIAGATLVTENSSDPAKTLKLLEREKVTLYRGWPDQAVQLAAHPDFAGTDLSSLQGASLQALLPSRQRGAAGSRATMLGMTETFGPYTGWPLDQDLPKTAFGAAGKPLGETQVRIVDPATGEAVPTGETGSIQVGGPNILRGICGREREEVFTRDGWYDTGDLGRMDADGFVYFAGRRDDMFKVKGASVYPTEVEEALMAIPGVRRAFASEVTIDGASAVGAAVLPDEGASLDPASLTAAVKARLSAFKIPSRWLVLRSLDELPTLPTGKLDKAAFKALLERS
jgi:acyl-CoA synthetase (AMP-forming)/AMP-acid ligase II